MTKESGMSHFTKGNEYKQVRLRKATEDFMLNHTVEEFRNFILQNSEVEEDEDEFARFIPDGEHHFVTGKTYDMQGEDLKGDEFIITEDGRVFFALSLIENIEVVNDSKTYAVYDGHKEELQEALERHKHWLEEDVDGWEDMRADLRGADLRGVDLSGADLESAVLRWADLRGAWLEGAVLRRADLRGARLGGVDLRGAWLEGADLSGAWLEGADLSGACLDGTKF